MKRKIVVGVWKDKLLPSESIQRMDELSRLYDGKNLCFDACVAASPISLMAVKGVESKYPNSPVKVIGQDVHWPNPKCSFTGSTSIPMLKEVGIDMCMIGHSERRRFFGESDEDIYKKLQACIASDVYPILAIGDDVIDYAERKRILIEQITGALCPKDGERIDVSKMAIAYEPVWAISTWRSAQALPNGKDVDDVMNLVYDILTDHCHFDVSETPLLYGGSVAPSNVEEYFTPEIVDGALVGGASLKVDSLATIYDVAQKLWSK